MRSASSLQHSCNQPFVPLHQANPQQIFVNVNICFLRRCYYIVNVKLGYAVDVALFDFDALPAIELFQPFPTFKLVLNMKCLFIVMLLIQSMIMRTSILIKLKIMLILLTLYCLHSQVYNRLLLHMLSLRLHRLVKLFGRVFTCIVIAKAGSHGKEF